MGWKRAKFKGKDVWVEVDGTGQPKAVKGRVPMRYSNRAGAAVYGAGVANLEMSDSTEIEELPDGEGADAKQKAKKAKRSKSRGSGFGKAGTRTAAQTAKAAADAAQKLDALDPNTTVAFTDGGCRGNPGPAGSGVWITFADGRWAEASRSLGRGTNNIAELTAIEIALDLLDEAELPVDAAVVLFSDSSYANGVLTKGWKAKKNTELILGLREKLSRRPGVDLQWVAGHAGVEGNERADRLATAGVHGKTAVRWGPDKT